MKVHELKCAPAGFEPLARGQKHVELRNEDDRHYEVGDVLVLREWDGDDGAGDWTGRHRLARITHLIRASEEPFGAMLAKGIVALSVRIFREPRSI